jgi:glutathione S-transferase
MSHVDTAAAQKPRLYDFELSGNCYKVRLLLSLLAIEHEKTDVDFFGGAHKSADFLRVNALGQVPVLVEGDLYLRDSQAILVYLARRYGGADWLPEDAAGLARINQWLSNAANEIAHGFAAARAFHLLKRAHIDIDLATTRAHAFLRMLDEHLASRTWLEFERPTIADIACFPYIALAHQGQIELAGYSHVRSWIDRIKRLPGFVAMPGIEWN